MTADALAGILQNDQTLSEKYFHLSYQEMSAVIHTTTALVLNKAMQTLWPCGVNSDVSLLVTGTVPYMKGAAK
jgi:hypothetical protein